MIDWDPGFWWGNSSWGDKDGAAYEIQVSRDPYRCNTAERKHETKSWRFTAEHNTERGRAFHPRVGIVLQHTNTDVAFFSSKSVKYGGSGREREANWGEQAPHPGWGWNLINAASQLPNVREADKVIYEIVSSTKPQDLLLLICTLL